MTKIRSLFRCTKTQLSWALYDVASSAFTMILATIIPIYINSIGAEYIGKEQAGSLWGYINSGATLIVAFLSPIMGAMADRRGSKKRYFAVFLLCAIAASTAMSLSSDYTVLIVATFFALVGYAACNVFYDSFLTDVAEDSELDRISSLGFGLGYIGSCIPFIASILLVGLKPFNISSVEAVKISIILNTIWWIIFSIPLLVNVKQRIATRVGGGVLDALRSNIGTFRELISDRQMFMFLIAYFLYIDAVDTIITMSTTFGNIVGIPESQMLLALLVMQVVAFPAVIIFAKMSEKYSCRSVLLCCIVVYIGITLYAVTLENTVQFWVLAIAIALVQGTVQALSRSMFGKLIKNKEKSNEYYGFYNIFGRYAAVIGPVLVGIFTSIYGKMQYGIFSVTILFALGFVVLFRVRENIA